MYQRDTFTFARRWLGQSATVENEQSLKNLSVRHRTNVKVSCRLLHTV